LLSQVSMKRSRQTTDLLPWVPLVAIAISAAGLAWHEMSSVVKLGGL
jgi:hypothetical protein